jgi:hypothetical protein
MKFLFVYHGGDVPADKTKGNIDDLWEWINALSHEQKLVSSFIANGGKTVSRGFVEDYRGRVFGMSVIESPSLDDAVRLAEGWPELQYGGHLDILQEL